MIRKVSYCCEKCGAVYEREKDAARCEASHPGIWLEGMAGSPDLKFCSYAKPYRSGRFPVMVYLPFKDSVSGSGVTVLKYTLADLVDSREADYVRDLEKALMGKRMEDETEDDV